MSRLIDADALLNELWKALFNYEDKTEKQFLESNELDIGDWILHRIFVQNMSDIDRQTVLKQPTVDDVEVVRCDECAYRRRCMLQHFVESNAVDGTKIDWSEWYCADGVRDINIQSKSDERREG